MGSLSNEGVVRLEVDKENYETQTSNERQFKKQEIWVQKFNCN